MIAKVAGMDNRTVRIAVYERIGDEQFWRLRSTYESGSEADTPIRSFDDIWEHADAQGIPRADVKFVGNSFKELSQQP